MLVGVLRENNFDDVMLVFTSTRAHTRAQSSSWTAWRASVAEASVSGSGFPSFRRSLHLTGAEAGFWAPRARSSGVFLCVLPDDGKVDPEPEHISDSVLSGGVERRALACRSLANSICWVNIKSLQEWRCTGVTQAALLTLIQTIFPFRGTHLLLPVITTPYGPSCTPLVL